MTTKESNPKDAIGDTKVPLWLLSPIAKAHWALGHFVGLLKYGAWNWRAVGVRASVYLSAAQRHLDAYASGEEYDPVDGTHHLGNAMACCGIILDARAAGKLHDDRPPSVSIRETYDEAVGIMARLRKQYADLKPRHYTIADKTPVPVNVQPVPLPKGPVPVNIQTIPSTWLPPPRIPNVTLPPLRLLDPPFAWNTP